MEEYETILSGFVARYMCLEPNPNPGACTSPDAPLRVIINSRVDIVEPCGIPTHSPTFYTENGKTDIRFKQNN